MQQNIIKMKTQALNIPDSSGLTFEKVWLMFQETKQMFQENEKKLTEKFADTDQKIKKLSEL